MDRTDGELIGDFCNGDEAAFGVLVRRHVDVVYAAALRHTHDPGAADDVTQAVFLVLAKKARRLRRHVTIAGWLIVVTGYVARSAIRARTRRLHHERAAAHAEGISMDRSNATNSELAEMLDDALARLRAADRDAITLRYLQAKSLADVGRVLGISEEAARKRVTRGIERLREIFEACGVPVIGCALSDAIAAFAAPTAPAATVAAIASRIAPLPPAISLSKGVLRMFAIKEIAVVSTLVLLGLCAAAAVTVYAQENPGPAPAPPIARALPAPAVPRPINLELNTVALQLAVTDIEANMRFFEKVGFRVRFMDKPDANGKLVRATVDSGSIRIRMYRVAVAPRPEKNLIPYFWIDGGATPLAALRAQIASRGIDVGPLGKSMQLLQFDLRTPDGYVVGFYTQP